MITTVWANLVFSNQYLVYRLFNGMDIYHLYNRWDQTPLSEAMRHHHPQIVGYMKRIREGQITAGKPPGKNGSPYEVVYDRGVTTI